MSRQTFSALALLRRGLSGHRGWLPQWRKAQPKPSYDAVIVGGGGHGLGTAYYLAEEHGLGNIAVLEKGWIGGGNTGRNTTIIRSNYLFNESAALYDHSLKLWESLSQALNYNVMFSPRGVMMLAHTVHDIQVSKRHIHANRCNGVDNEWLEPEQAKEFCPPLNIEHNIRYPVLGAALQRRGGTARHDAVAWGYARAADALGVDIIENCEVTGIRRTAEGAVEALETTRGLDPLAQGRRVRRRPHQRGLGLGRRALAAGELSAAGAGIGADQTRFSLRGDVEYHPCLYQPVGQGRAGHRRRHRRLHLVHPARRAARQHAHARCHLRAVSAISPPANAAQLGRHRRCDPGPLADHRQDAGAGAVRQLRLGHRRLQGHARRGACICLDHRSRRAAPDQRAVHHRALSRRLFDRRGRGRGRGA